MKRKIAAIFAADIAGYSRLVAEDEEETLRRLAAYRAVTDDFIAKAGGRIFNTAGDAVLAEFPSAVEAVRCSIDIQESLRTRNMAYPPSRQMNFRIGITIGDVVERDGDLLGDGVNIAARLEGLAEVGGICVSRGARAGRQQAVGTVRRYRRAGGQEHPDPGACLYGGDAARGRNIFDAAGEEAAAEAADRRAGLDVAGSGAGGCAVWHRCCRLSLFHQAGAADPGQRAAGQNGSQLAPLAVAFRGGDIGADADPDGYADSGQRRRAITAAATLAVEPFGGKICT
jgi:Adenylate and Guanylate cyclase catalytic domain